MSIEAISNRWAKKLKDLNPEETASVEVMSYALQGIIHNFITIFTALVIGLVTGHFVDTFFAVVCFMGLRLVSGGFHFQSALHCMIFSTVVFVAIPLIELSDMVLIVINAISLIILAIYSPSNIKAHIRVNERYFPVFKLISVVLVAINFFFLSPIATLAFFIQACTTISLKKEVR